MQSMNRRDFLKSASVTVAGLAMAAKPFPKAGPNAKKPNIIVIMADDISAREFPTYKIPNPTAGDAPCSTPVIEKMVKDGIQFQHSWATPLCHPTRGEIMTGRYACRTKWWSNRFGPYKDDKGAALYDYHLTLGQIAKQAGYAAQMVGKWQLEGERSGYSFDEYVMTPAGKYAARAPKGTSHEGKPSYYWNPGYTLINHPSLSEGKSDESFRTTWKDYAANIELKFIKDFMKRQHNTDTPFFVYWPAHMGHGNWDYENNRMGQPGVPPMDEKDYPGTEHINAKAPDGTIVRKTKPGMNYHIQYIDYLLGELIKQAEQLGILENTVIILTTDNGSGGYGKGPEGVIKETGALVPLFIYGPGYVKPRGVVDEPADLSDIAPTVAELMRLDCTAAAEKYGLKTNNSEYEFDGKSLLPYLAGKKNTHRDWIYSYNAEYQMVRTKNVVRDGLGTYWDCRGTNDQEKYRCIKNPEKSDLIAEIELIDKVIDKHPIPDLDSELYYRYIEYKGGGLARFYRGHIEDSDVPPIGRALLTLNRAKIAQLKKDQKLAEKLYHQVLQVKPEQTRNKKLLKKLRSSAEMNLKKLK